MRKSFLIIAAFLLLCFVPDAHAQVNCASVPSPCVTVTGVLSATNGLACMNCIITWQPSQMFWIAGGCSSNGGGTGGTYPYDVVFALNGLPDANTIFPIETFTRVVTLPPNFTGSWGTVGTNPTAPATFTLLNNGSQIGTVTIATDGTFTFASSGGTGVTFQVGDRLTTNTPVSQDATLSDVAFTLAGTRSQ